MTSIMNPGSTFQAPGLNAGALGSRPRMTEAQYTAGRANWLANGGQDSPQGQNMTPAQMAQMKAGGPIGTANASGTLTGIGQPPQTQAFGATNNLIGQQINPVNSGFTQGMQNRAQSAGDAYNNFQFGNFQRLDPMNFGAERSQLAGANSAMQGLGLNFGQANAAYGQAQNAITGLQGLGAGNFGSGGASASTGRFNQELDGALAGLQGPDRAKLAADAMGLMEERSRGEFDRSLREANARSAAMGRRGSGMTTNDLGDITLSREKLLDRSRRDLALDAAQRTLDDRMTISNQQRGVANDRFGAETFNAGLADAAAARDQQGRQFGASFQRGLIGDQMALGDRFGDQERDRVALGERKANFSRNIAGDTAGLGRDEWNSRQSERNAARGDEYDQNSVARSRFTDFMGATRDGWNQDRSNRNELRGERDFQYGLSRDAVDDEYRRMNFEEGLRDRRFGRAQGFLGSSGDAGQIAGAYGQAGAQQMGNAADSYAAFAQLMGQLGRGQRNTQRQPTG